MQSISLADRAAIEIRDRIVAGVLSPGSRVNIAAMSKELNISPTPIREALKKLIPEGLVVYKSRAGYAVRVLTLHEYLQVSEIHQALEIHLVREFAGTPGLIDQDDLHGINDELDALARNGDADGVARKNDAFHRKLYETYPNKLMISRLTDLWDGVRSQRDIMYRNNAFLLRVADEHRRILAAITAGNPDAAADAMRAHYVSGRESAVMSFPTNGA